MKDKYDFMKTTVLFENQIILSKKNFNFQKKKIHWKNGYKYGKEDAIISRWDIYYRDLQEAQKSSQSIEDQKLYIKIIYGFDNKRKIFRRKNYGWQDEEEADKDGGNVIYRDGIDAWEVSQSKERRKLGWVAKISDRGLTMT